MSIGITSASTLTTSVSSSYSTSAYVGEPYTVNAFINGSVALGVPRTGTLTLEDANGNTLAGPVNISTATANANGSFPLTIPGGLPLGANAGLQVVYSGDTNYATSTQTLKTINVNLIPDTIALNYTTPLAGQPLTINATLHGTVLTSTPRTGTLTLEDANGNVLAGPLDITTTTPNSDGSFSLSVPAGLSVGSQTLTVVYSGDSTYAPGSTNATLNITNDTLSLAFSSTTVVGSPFSVSVAILTPTSSSTSSNVQPAVVTATPPAPTGSLTLMQGTTVLASIADITQVAPDSSGFYTLTDSAGLALGDNTGLTVVYSGDANYSPLTVSLPDITGVNNVVAA